MTNFGWNYPPGVTGNEIEIAGPDYEKEWTEYPCPMCGEGLYEEGYQGRRWLSCACGWTRDLEPDDGPDPDAAYDAARDRRMFGIDRPDELEE